MPTSVDIDLMFYRSLFRFELSVVNMLMDSTHFEVLSVVPLRSFLESILFAFINDLRNSINLSIIHTHTYIYIYTYIYTYIYIYIYIQDYSK